MAKGQKKAIEPAVRDCTINLNKKVHKVPRGRVELFRHLSYAAQ